MMKWLKATAFAVALSCGAAHADTATLQSHAFAIGKGPGVSGYTALLCGAGTLPIGQSGADPSCIALSGDATINAAGVLTLAAVNANVGTFGSATLCITATVNAKGLTTAISTATCTPAIGSVTGLGAGVATALGTAVGSAGGPVTNGGALGTPSSGVGTNLTGTAAGFTAGHVTTNANLTGDCTSVGNATTCTSINGVNMTTAWTAFTPAASCGTATFTINSARSKTMGKTTWAQADITFTTIGTCTQVMTFSLPNTAQSSGGLSGSEIANSNIIANCRVAASSSVATCLKTAATAWAVNDRVTVSGVYENQ